MGLVGVVVQRWVWWGSSGEVGLVGVVVDIWVRWG